MNEFYDEYYTRFEYIDEPEWLYRRFPGLWRVWMSPVYQRLLFIRLWNRILDKPGDPWLTAALSSILIIIGLGFIIPEFFTLIGIAILFFMFFPVITRITNALFIRLPIRLKKYFGAKEIDPVFSVPLNDNEIFGSEICYTLFQDVGIYMLTVKFLALTILPVLFLSFAGVADSNAPFAPIVGIAGAIINTVVVGTLFICFLIVLAHISAILSIHVEILATTVAASAVAILLILAGVFLIFNIFTLVGSSLHEIDDSLIFSIQIFLMAVLGLIAVLSTKGIISQAGKSFRWARTSP